MDTPQAGSRVLRFPEPQVGVAFDEARIGPPGLLGLPTGALPPSGDSGVALSDLESLLQSVTHRLRSTVGAASTHGLRPLQTPAETEAAVFGVRACVLECAQAIDQLTATLSAELHRVHRFEMEVSGVRVALAHAQSDLARSRAGAEHAVHQSLHDGLTALPNRRYFRQQLDRSLALADSACQAFAVLYLDLDGFKLINDTHGHEAGDELLRIVAARLTHAVRGGDMVSRIGGDEFACLLADALPRAHLARLACKIFDAVSAPVSIGGMRLSVRPSIGIATCPADGVTTADLLRNADLAMFLAKRQQSGHAFFDEFGADA